MAECYRSPHLIRVQKIFIEGVSFRRELKRKLIALRCVKWEGQGSCEDIEAKHVACKDPK